MVNSLTLSRRQLHAACDAWGRTPTTGGGTLGLGLWLSRHKDYHTVADYADLLAMVRAEMGDETDYSAFYDREVSDDTQSLQDEHRPGTPVLERDGGGFLGGAQLRTVLPDEA